ncbi:class C beta-lactamase [Massilia glaciei]|uniref:Beta-lactamase n=1 Tax=Massilia glaciei TaxID=1524097 RepID=A0A2U2HDN8_9BURK|nr:class C beta-lactamase [Massilia glaciei]PWF41234.1 class C beta-lactamase [Massilia glaciei]
MTILNRSLAIALVSTCFLPCTSWAADDSARIRAIVDNAIGPVMAEHDVPGMAVAVTVDGRSYFFNYGVASREKNTPVSEATLFELGSVSKTLTGTLAAYAQVLGKLSLTDHPGKYIPQLRGSPIDKASLINIGTYTAGGLPQQFPDEISKDDQINAYFRDWKPDAAAGTQRTYSNPSIGLLGHITSLALKRDFADAMETALFPQLGLRHSYIRVPDGAKADYAWGYSKSNKPIRVNPDVFDDEAYGVKSSSADMIRFVQLNIAPSRLEAPMRRAVEATHVGHFRVGDMVQGLGWEQYAYPIALDRLLAGNSRIMSSEPNAAQPLTPPEAPSGPTLFNKTGSTGGFGNYVAFVPAEKIGIVMLANKSLPGPARIKAAHAILEQLVEKNP